MGNQGAAHLLCAVLPPSRDLDRVAPGPLRHGGSLSVG